jgi:hypothetical protein
MKKLKRFILSSDNHNFVGKYVFDVNHVLSTLIRRVESLNVVGGMLWPTNMPKDFKEFPVSRYEWLNVSADVFLARYISVVDCAMILANEIFECGLSFEASTLRNLKKTSVSRDILIHFREMIDDQGQLRKERNSRFHHGVERAFSSDEMTLRTGALFEHWGQGMVGPNGQKLPIDQLFKEGLVELQKEFNGVMKKVVEQLDHLYDMLQPEFEARFSPKFKVGPFARRDTA